MPLHSPFYNIQTILFSLCLIPQSCNQEYFRCPLVRVDPERRCSVMLIYGTHLVVLPFRQEGVLDEHEQEGAFTGRYNILVINNIYDEK